MWVTRKENGGHHDGVVHSRSQPAVRKDVSSWLTVLNALGFDDRPYHSADLKEGASWKRGALFHFRTLHRQARSVLILTFTSRLTNARKRRAPSAVNRYLEGSMAELVPVGYLSRREAVDVIVRSLVAGKPDQPLIKKLRERGIDAADGVEIDEANAELWRGIDEGKMEVFAVGPNGQLLRMEGSLTKQVPWLRNPRVGDFTFSRPTTSAHAKLVAQFGPNLGSIYLAFREQDVKKWARSLLRRRRSVSVAGKPRVGRPSRKASVMPAIRELVVDHKWNATMSVKTLTHLVNRDLKPNKPISEDTVTRALDQLYQETGDRNFQRVVRKVA
jgi:hypothetical protein